MYPIKCLLKTLLVFHLFHFSTSIDTIILNQYIKDGEVIVSSRKVFALGFFSPGSSSKRYVGVWYNQVSEPTIVWVANRNNPINDTSGVLSINSNGNLVLFERNQTIPVWSTNVSNTPMTATIAQLLDSGNLVLVQNDAQKKLLWQSFDYPTNTMLPFMKLGLDRRTGLNRLLRPWKFPDDPASGNFSYKMDPSGFPQFSLYKGTAKWWRTGSWTGRRWIGVPEMTDSYIFNSTYVDNEDEVSIMFLVTKPSLLSRMTCSETGFHQLFTWSDQNHKWIESWSAPKEQCDYYGHCGPNGNCDPSHADEFECKCLPGFEPKNPGQWYLRDGSDGCRRKQGMSPCESGEGFVRVVRVKVPDTSVTHVDMSLGLKACEDKCLKNCSCLAYTSAYVDINGGTGCLTYHGDMIDTRTYTNAGQDLFVRVNAIELALYRKNSSFGKKDMVAIVISFVVMILVAASVCWFFRRRKRAENMRKSSYASSFAVNLTHLDSFSNKEHEGSGGTSDLPIFSLSTVAAATDNFSVDNKLGEGGFGSVYKGQLDNGKEIAVKRLSQCSGQGIEEFKNEVKLIAKLQHRNLTSILGCCIEAEEKMLIYEYLPNKSLDAFIFNETKRSLLDWSKRFEIICGIARGILYLHQDSRLRIIHRDLKASNVLLDAAMNPKISDFGMARIFGGDEIEANTNRVVGTYGYMSPEYAMEGLFSIKSDVYSFGVLLLEIISGRKNKAFYSKDATSSNLVGHVWDLWRDGRSIEIVDKSLGDSYPAHEVLRCVQIALLCVQEQARDRPSMSMVVSFLGNDIDIPSPDQPAFIAKKTFNSDDTAGSSEVVSSVNEVTMSITMFQGR